MNAPNNVIVTAGKTRLNLSVLTMMRTSFTRNVEKIFVQGRTGFSMGSETVVLPQAEASAGKY